MTYNKTTKLRVSSRNINRSWISKFRANNGWDINWEAKTVPDGSHEYGGDNIAVTAVELKVQLL
jgi:hypothetical protein